jgi:hypothetical protein
MRAPFVQLGPEFSCAALSEKSYCRPQPDLIGLAREYTFLHSVPATQRQLLVSRYPALSSQLFGMSSKYPYDVPAAAVAGRSRIVAARPTSVTPKITSGEFVLDSTPQYA